MLEDQGYPMHEVVALRAARIYFYGLGALSAVRLVFLADDQLVGFLDQRSWVFQIADLVESGIGLGALFPWLGEKIFGLAAGRGELAAAFNNLGFYLMSPLLVASFVEFSRNKSSMSRNVVGVLFLVVGYFMLYGVGIFFVAAMWPAFVLACLFAIPINAEPPLPKVRAETWKAFLSCLAAVAFAIVVSMVA